MHPTRLRCSVTSPEQSLPANWQSVQNQFTAVDREIEGMVERGDERVWLLDSVKALAEAVRMRHRGPHGVGGVARTEESESGRPVESSLATLRAAKSRPLRLVIHCAHFDIGESHVT